LAYRLLAVCASAALFVITSPVSARDYISIVGSSTVYPFATVVAENLGRTTKYKTPKIESTGSGAGMKLFCNGVGVQTPDITNASRRIKKSEQKLCARNGIRDIIEVKIGYDGIVLAQSKAQQAIDLSRRDIYLALAKQIPDPKDPESGRLIPNPHKTWRDVNPDLPDRKIQVLGPPPTSGTRDAFSEIAMEGGCREFGWIRKLEKEYKAMLSSGNRPKGMTLRKNYWGLCHGVREDGAFIEAGENDNLLVQKLSANPELIGIFGYSYLQQNKDLVEGATIEGIPASFENIADGKYPISRPLYFYVKKAHVGKIPGIAEYIEEFTRESTWGAEGYLVDRGMVPMPDMERAIFKSDAEALIPMQALR
jgi:phosphate transport system substrate-binding protein